MCTTGCVNLLVGLQIQLQTSILYLSSWISKINASMSINIDTEYLSQQSDSMSSMIVDPFSTGEKYFGSWVNDGNTGTTRTSSTGCNCCSQMSVSPVYTIYLILPEPFFASVFRNKNSVLIRHGRESLCFSFFVVTKANPTLWTIQPCIREFTKS